jgi:1-acyl-sn-glycerol-3-phosphate acyltransferase
MPTDPAQERPVQKRATRASVAAKTPTTARKTAVATADTARKRADKTAGRMTKKVAATASAAAPAKTSPARQSPSSRDALAAGAARASGERARRTRTPLLDASPEPPPAVPEAGDPAVEPLEVTARHTEAKHRPRPSPRAAAPSAKAVAHSGGRTERRQRNRTTTARRPGPHAARTLAAVPDAAVPDAGAPEVALTAPGAVHPGVEDVVGAAVAALRTVAAATGISSEEVEVQVARTLAFVRRRLTGDFDVDEFGFDEDFTTNVYLPLLRPLYRTWFRVEVRGVENLPAEGGGLVVANHSGTVAMDSLMTQVAVFDEHPEHRHLRMLGADLVFQTPVVAQVARKSGSTLAGNADAERLLGGGELVGVWPEGFKGVGKPFSERYKLQRFGRGGFVSAAIRTGVPIIPCSIIGAEEIYPILGNMKTLARVLGAPYAPVTPTWPLLGPLGLIPLPSKWIIEFGVPVETQDLGPGAADDPMLVFDLTDQIRETIQQSLYSLLMQRRSVFF